MRPLFLASATAPALTRAEMVVGAGIAGFDGVGLRFDLAPPTRGELVELQRVLADNGLTVLDIEVVRIGNEDRSTTDVLFEAALTLGAKAVLTVSDTSNEIELFRRLDELADKAAAQSLVIALEFMPFTAIKTLAQALWVVQHLGRPEVMVLADALHMQRSGSAFSHLSEAASEVCYLQLCDAPIVSPPDDARLIEEARFGRLMPGSGELDLRTFLRSVPQVPISVEVQSVELRQSHTPTELAVLAYRTAKAVTLDSELDDLVRDDSC